MNWKRSRVAVMMAGALVSMGVAQNLQVKTKLGKIEGRMDGPAATPVRAFLGIPFAAPPVGQLRWKQPMPAAKWKGVREAKGFGPRCMQPSVFSDMIFRDAGMSEDCLTLNIWTPAGDAKAKLPVMVWIYGGGFLGGSTSERRQDGAQLASNGVVVVTMNYRLGIFGFFTHHELAAESGHNAAGNYGLMDQTAALRWVKENIAAFGGDPGKVTLFGESAGSFSVSAQMASPLAKGLYQRAIGESGGALGTSTLSFRPVAETEARDEAFALETFSTASLAGLRAISAQQMLDGQMKKNAKGEMTRFSGGVDGYFLPESPHAIFAAGRQNDVPMIAGWNRDEGGFDPKATVASFQELVRKQYPDHVTEVLALYAAPDDGAAPRAQADLEGDRFIAYSTWQWLEAQTKTGKQSVYRYEFDQASPPDPFHPGGVAAYHSSEIPYVFGALDLLSSVGYNWRPEDRALSTEMQKYWTNFAKTGDPNGDGLPKWPAYTPATQWQVMHLAPESRAETDTHRDRDLFLDGLLGK